VAVVLHGHEAADGGSVICCASGNKILDQGWNLIFFFPKETKKNRGIRISQYMIGHQPVMGHTYINILLNHVREIILKYLLDF
jgi:hypothetical protein